MGGTRAHSVPQLGRDTIRIDNSALILPCLPGKTLAALLDDPMLADTGRTKAIEYATAALAEFHRLGFTHGDAMAENVMIDLDAGVARWFDFETVHDDSRPMTWRRADDVRALLFTCVLRTVANQRAATIELILDAYGDEEVTVLLATSFTLVWQRGLTYHLGQAPLSFEAYREIRRLLRDRQH